VYTYTNVCIREIKREISLRGSLVGLSTTFSYYLPRFSFVGKGRRVQCQTTVGSKLYDWVLKGEV
jgi:hypothetical protein